MNIGYFADGPWSHEALNRIQADDRFSLKFICARYSNPDPFLEKMAIKLGIDFYVHPNINSREFVDAVSSHCCDILVSMSFDQIFRADIINATPGGIINCHAGNLPFYRGRNVLNWALINDESEFGVTVHYVDVGIDTGDILVQQLYPISEDDDYKTLLNRSYKYCADLLYLSLDKIITGKVNRIKQKSIHKTGFYCVKRLEGDEIIDWNQSSRAIHCFVRAITSPGPCARSFLNGHQFKIIKTRFLTDVPPHKLIPGAIVGISEDEIFVKTLDTVIAISEYEYSGRFKVGDRFL